MVLEEAAKAGWLVVAAALATPVQVPYQDFAGTCNAASLPFAVTCLCLHGVVFGHQGTYSVTAAALDQVQHQRSCPSLCSNLTSSANQYPSITNPTAYLPDQHPQISGCYFAKATATTRTTIVRSLSEWRSVYCSSWFHALTTNCLRCYSRMIRSLRVFSGLASNWYCSGCSWHPLTPERTGAPCLYLLFLSQMRSTLTGTGSVCS